jgi:nicotinamidase-related amidase
MDAAREAGIPVIVVQQTSPASSPLFAIDTDGWQLHPVVASRPRDHYLRKLLPSAYPETDLAQWLEARGIDTLTVVGYMTHNCDASTINHALHNGTAVEFLHDASGAVPYQNQAGFASAEEIHRVFSVVLQSRFAAVMSTQEWVHSVKTGAVPVRDNIYKSNQRARGLLKDDVAQRAA